MHTMKSRRIIAVITGIILTACSTIGQRTEALIEQGPIITPDSSEIVIQNGENYTLICKSNRNITFKQQEQAEDMTLPFTIISRNISSSDPEYPHVIEIDLLNVNEHAVGYFACFDDTIDFKGVLGLNSLKSEPNNTEHITYIYVYVNGSENLFAPMNQVVTVNDDDTKVVIGCRPISPDIKVEINAGGVKYETYNPKIGFTLHMDNFNTQKLSLIECVLKTNYYPYIESTIDVYIDKYVGSPEEPTIIGMTTRYFLEGDTFSINCYVKYQNNLATHLAWKLPTTPDEDLWSRVINNTNENYRINDKLYNNITIVNATKNYNGTYFCISNDAKSKSVKVEFLAEPFLDFSSDDKRILDKIKHKIIKIQFKLKSYPKAIISIYKNGVELPLTNNNNKYLLKPNYMDFLDFYIYNVTVEDSANYTITANNKYLTRSLSFDRRVARLPTLSMDLEDRTYVMDTYTNNYMSCNVSGYPLPKVYWQMLVTSYGSQQNYTLKNHYEEAHSLYQLTSFIDLSKFNYSGVVICSAVNDQGESSISKNVHLYEVEKGFGIKDKENTWFVEGQNVELTCVAAFSKYNEVTWLNVTESDQVSIVVAENNISNLEKLYIKDIKKEQSGEYVCQGVNGDDFETDSIYIFVHETSPVEILYPVLDEELDVYPFQNVSLVCKATGIPKPNIYWKKDNELLFADRNGTYILDTDLSNTDVESKLYIVNMNEENGGKYECVANNSEGTVLSSSFQVYVNTKTTNGMAYLGIIAIIFFILLIVIIYLTLKVRKEKMFRKELAKAGLLYFKEGVTKSLNPDLGVDEQAELLPYDERFEFPPEKLLLGKQLGSGAFGVVYKAEARGIVNAEEDTTVAVKMVKKTADNMYIKALASELKIMVHLGKHINIVNLLGACTKNVGKRELNVIVEYCKFGNIHDYMIKHREVFIDQLNENSEHSVGRVNRGFSCSSGNSGTHSSYFGSHCTQDTDHTFLNTAGTNRSGPRKDNGTQQLELGKVSESGYVQPMWSSNYESDYSYDGRAPRPLASRDLLCWAFQIARGMEYLVSRKVLHGDLAARNILLAEGNVIKICDFGLARSVYKNDEYQKNSNSPLPVKWLAIECITDRIFSTQSDVWSFGIVLWELFTLGKTPYPGINPTELLPWLASGKRLDKPRYANDDIYEVMNKCWETKPTARPSFTSLQETLGSFLEDNVRAHYVDLNTVCQTSNQECIQSGTEDYLAMMLAPDYNNHVKPSPHHYVNDTNSFFPPIIPLQDDEGYLQMNPGSRGSMLNGQHVFDFESRKSSSREASEYTPMLTLNNLPARSGSESDHEGSSSPHLNICPPIEEETDDVFEVKQNNMKNASQRAVTNPTYIAFNDDLEKKPLTNNYANIGNGLVT